MKSDFCSVLETPWGKWAVYAGMQGVTLIEHPAPEKTELPPVPFDLDHAWEAYATGLSDCLHVPIDLTADVEAQLFYTFLRGIPRGESRSLYDLARKSAITIEQARAYYDECPFPLVFPLHRVADTGRTNELWEEIVRYEAEHPLLPRPVIPWQKTDKQE